MKLVHGQILAKEGAQLRVAYGPGGLTARCASSLDATQLLVGDYVVVGQVNDSWWAIAKLAQDSTRLPLGTTSGSGTTTGSVVPPTTTFDDSALLRRDGTRSLLGAARWVWEAGAELAGVLRSWGSGWLQVFGQLFVGRISGPRVGLGNYRNDFNLPSYVFEVVDKENMPFISFGAVDSADVAAIWGQLGYFATADYQLLPRIHFETVAGYGRKIPLVDAALLNGTVPAAQIAVDSSGFSGMLGVGDTTVQQALTTLDSHYHAAVNGSFTTADNKTVTVTDGIITAIT